MRYRKTLTYFVEVVTDAEDEEQAERDITETKATIEGFLGNVPDIDYDYDPDPMQVEVRPGKWMSPDMAGDWLYDHNLDLKEEAAAQAARIRDDALMNAQYYGGEKDDYR